MAKIIGNTTATPNPRPDWLQTDSNKADYIKNKPVAATEIDENSTDKQYASAKAVFDLVKSAGGIKTLDNPNLWELETGIYLIKNGFYYNVGKQITLIDGLLFLSKSVISNFIVYVNGTSFYYRGGIINNGTNGSCEYYTFENNIDEDEPSYNKYVGEKSIVDFVKKQMGGKVDKEAIITKITETSTNEEIASAKAIVDYIGNLKHIETLTEDTDIDGDFPSGVYLTNGYLVKFLDSEGHMLFNNAYFPVLLIHYRLSDGRYFGLYHECSPTNDEYYGGYISMYNSEYGKKVLADEDFVRDQISSLVGSAPEVLDTIEELSAALNNNPDILESLVTKTELSETNSKINETLNYVDEQIENITDSISDVITEEGKSGEKIELPTSQAVQTELDIVNTKIEDLLEYTNKHLGDISDLITDKMTEEGLDGTNKVELPTARAINDYVENKLSNYTTQATQVQIITWEADD